MKYRINKLAIIDGPKNSGGPMTWKNGLVAELRTNNIEVVELENKVTDLFKNIVRLAKVKVVHAYSLTINSFILILIALVLNKKIVFTLHGNYFSEKKSKNGIKKILFVPGYNLIMKMSSIVTFPSLFLKNGVTSRIDLTDKAQVVPNGIVANKESINKPKRSINLWTKKRRYNFLEVTGFNYKEKAMGVVPLIGAINKYNKRHTSKIYLNILGDGRFLNDYLYLQSKYISFLGHKNIEKYLLVSDVCIHSTLLDNMPYSLIESMMASKPIIATRTGGIPEMMDKRCLCEPETESLYKKIKLYLDEPEYARETVRANNLLLGKFEWSNVVKKFLRIYESL